MQPNPESIAGNVRPSRVERRPLRTLATLVGSAMAGVLVLVSGVATGGTAERHPGPWYALSDTDSTAIDTSALGGSGLDKSFLGTSALDTSLADTTLDSLLSTLTDSSLVDSSLADTLHTPLADFYIPARRRDKWTAAPVQRRGRPFHPRLGNYWKHEVELDSIEHTFTIREYVGRHPVRYPLTLGFQDYRTTRLSADLEQGWHEIIEQRLRQRQQRSRGGLGFNIVIPGGQQSAFTTIFGKNEVDLRVNGQADIKAGFDYRKSDQQVAFTGRASQVDPDFKQDLKLGITGSIGDKLRVDVNWDTNNQFEYQNQLRLQYQGYEDEIIRNIEAGNVHLTTPSRLIRGGQSLFGIKSQFQLGGLQLTTVASQQEGQSNNLAISGGAETTPIDLRPTDYDESTHFFLGYYFRNRWEDALSAPPNIIVGQGFDHITDIEVWKLESGNTSPEEQNARQVLAMVDLGEDPLIIQEANNFTQAILPSADTDRYDEAILESQIRIGETYSDYLKAQGLSDDDYQPGRFKKLIRGRDYVLDEVLGYISLNQRVGDQEAIAVAYRFSANGQEITIGDFSTQTGGSTGGQNEKRLALKLLKPTTLRQPAQDYNPAAWYLELRNIYRLPARGLNPNDFELQIEHQPPGKQASKVVSDFSQQRATLLQQLGLDRLNVDGAVQPDDRFDYLIQYTIDPSSGKLIFPYLQPFGSRIRHLIEVNSSSQSEIERKEKLYVFDALYTQKKDIARRDFPQFDVYRLSGSYKGSVQEFYDLRAYAGLVEGSVRVTSGGSRLTEGADFVVDYQGGNVTITNPAYLTAGRDIDITYEQNSFFNLQKKTLLGARADYNFGDNLALGGTIFNLNQKSPIDKFRIGEEPISNTIWGVDGAFNLQPHWLTRAVDALPFIQTKAPSSIQITGEFAQLRPGASQTIAFERSRKNLTKLGRDFNSDELQGISYLDDFEGFENTYSLKQPGAWRLTAAPDSISRFPGDLVGTAYDSLRTNWRAAFGWYTIHRNILNELGTPTKATEPVHINDVFPEKDREGTLEDFITTLDIYFDPHQRGPYNYTRDLKDFLENPKDTWGGMIQRLPEGYTDFNQKNTEFIEFIIRPFPAGGESSRGAKLYVDIGSISEDVIPNGKLNTEDGLPLSTVSPADLDHWSRASRGVANSVIDVDESLRRTEDLGLDGLASYDDSYPELMTEHFVFRDFLNSLDRSDPDPRYQAEVAKAIRDPSGDDFFYFGADYFKDPRYFPNGASIQERFLNYFPGMEINSFEAQQKLAPSIHGKRGNSRIPDTEDLNLNSALDLENSYFQYELPLSQSMLDSLAAPDRVDDYVVTQITSSDGRETGWYQVRIPVRDYTRRVGTIQDFTQIESIRVWTTGHEAPVTVRFAEFELVGSQWQKSQAVTREREDPTDELMFDTRLSISSINNEENADIYKTPEGTIKALNRLSATGSAPREAREQAMMLRVERLMPGKQRAIYKTYTQGMDLLKYSNLRMFTHMHGLTAAGVPIESRDKVKLFLRLGANESGDYYEYEMPLTPSPISGSNADALWQTHQMVNGQPVDLNSVNLLLGALNQLKVTRDERVFPTDSVFWSDLGDVPLSPALEDFAPPGTRLGIKGTPSLARVSTVVVGIRNAADSTFGGADNRRPEDILQDVTVWLNELRVSGYDETNGWAALANADIRLADLGSIKASWQLQTDGFGGLESTLGQRETKNIDNWSVTADFNVDKFIPERFGWSLPVSVQVQSNTSTPRFAPNRGDIRLEELVSQISEDDHLSEAERRIKRQEAIEGAQNSTRTQSFTTRIQKSRSTSRLLRNTLDGLSFNYSFSNSDARDPSQRTNDNWRWTTTLNYRLNVRKPRTFKPFGFLESIPFVGILGDLQFNYVPQSVTAGATAARTFSERQDRPRGLAGLATDDLPDLVEFPLRQQHALSHRRNFGLQYNPFQFLNLSYDASTNQSMNALGVDTLFSVIVRNGDASETLHRNMTRAQADALGILPDSLFGVSGFEILELQVAPSGQVINRIFSGHEGLRSEQHNSRFTGSFRPNFSQSRALNWITFQDVVYGSQFRWQNGSVGRPTGATVGNQLEIRGGVTLKPQELFRKIPFYETIEEAQKKYTQDKEAAQRRAEQERLREKQERDRINKQREEAAENGEEPPEPVVKAVKDTTKSGRGFKLPLPNPLSLLRQTVLAITGIRDLSITYNANQSATSTNVGTPLYDGENLIDVESNYSILDGLRGNAPSLGYRFGFQRHLPLHQRAIDQRFQVTDVLQDGNQLQGRTSINPSQSLQINLTWNANWDTGTNFSYRPIGSAIDVTTTTTGSNRASVWAFKANYLDLFSKQLDAFEKDLGASGSNEFGDANGDGRVVLTNKSVVQDFQDTFLSGFGTVDRRGLLPFPMPNWTASYTGIAKWPLIRKLVNSATVRHGYSSDYSTDYRQNPISADSSRTFDLGGNRISFSVPREEVGGIRLNERYQPMIGLDFVFKGRIQTSFAWNQSTSYSLSTTNFELSENNTDELSFTLGYQRQGMKLPFFGKKLNNRITFNLTVSRSELSDQRYSIRRALVDRITKGDEFVLEDALSGDNVSVITASTRFTMVPRVSYQFSNRVSADFTLRYENFQSEDSRQPSTSTMNGGFNVRVSIAN